MSMKFPCGCVCVIQKRRHQISLAGWLSIFVIPITADKVGLNGAAEMRFQDKNLDLSMKDKDYSLTLSFEVVKSPV
jgi:hypothetical protein